LPLETMNTDLACDHRSDFGSTVFS